MSYNTQFKRIAITLLDLLKEEESVFPPNSDKEIKNVRALTDYLGVSSASLYSWAKKYNPLPLSVLYGYDSDYNEEDHEYPNEEFEENKEFNTDFDIEIDEGTNDNVFGIRYYSWFAKTKGIKGYSSMNLNELKVAIANKLLNEANGGDK